MKGFFGNKTAKIAIAAISAVMLAGVGTYTVWAINSQESAGNTAENQQIGYKDTVYNETEKMEYNEEISEAPSAVVSHEAPVSDSASSADIGIERAKEIALSQVGGADRSDIVKAERDYDDGRLEYEIKIIYNGYEYEYEIAGSDGSIISSDMEYCDYD